MDEMRKGFMAKSLDFNGLTINQILLQHRRQLLARVQTPKVVEDDSWMQKKRPVGECLGGVVQGLLQSRNATDLQDLTVRKDTETDRPQLSILTQKDAADLFLGQTMDISQPNKSSESFNAPTPPRTGSQTKLDEFAGNSKATVEAQGNTNRIARHDVEHTARLSPTRTSQGQPLASPTSSVLVQRREQVRSYQRSPNDEEPPGQRAPGLLYRVQQSKEVSAGQVAFEQPPAQERAKSIYDNQNHLNKMLRANPPKYMQRRAFGTSFKFLEKAGPLKQNSKLLSPTNAPPLRQSQKLLNSNLRARLHQRPPHATQTLQVTGEPHRPQRKPPTSAGLASKWRELANQQKKQRNMNVGTTFEDAGAWRDEDAQDYEVTMLSENECYPSEGQGALLLKAEPKSTQRKDPRKSESGLLAADVGKQGGGEQQDIEPQILQQQTRGASQLSCIQESRYSSRQKNVPLFNIDLWEPRMISVPTGSPHEKANAFDAPNSNSPRLVKTAAMLQRGKQRYMKSNARLCELNQNQLQLLQKDQGWMRDGGHTPAPAISSSQKRAGIQSCQYGKRDRERSQRNPFKAVQKGLVASRNVERSIQKLSNQFGSFANQDDIQVTVQPSRTKSFNGKMKENSKQSRYKTTFHKFMAQTSLQSPLNSVNLKSNDLENSQPIGQPGASLTSQNRCFKAQSTLLGSADAQVLVQSQNSDQSSTWFSAVGNHQSGPTSPLRLALQYRVQLNCHSGLAHGLNSRKHRSGSRQLFTLPTTAIADLRKEILKQRVGLVEEAMPTGVVTKQVDLKENYRRRKRKGGGLLLAAEAREWRQAAAGIDGMPNNTAFNDDSAVILDEPETYRAHLLEDSAAKRAASNCRRSGHETMATPNLDISR